MSEKSVYILKLKNLSTVIVITWIMLKRQLKFDDFSIPTQTHVQTVWFSTHNLIFIFFFCNSQKTFIDSSPMDRIFHKVYSKELSSNWERLLDKYVSYHRKKLLFLNWDILTLDTGKTTRKRWHDPHFTSFSAEM